MNDTRTDEELRAVMAAGEDAAEELSRRSRAQSEAISERVKRTRQADPTAAFRADELVFAAHDRCACGAGMAYPIGCSVHDAWHCSAILRGIASRELAHSAPLPFSFYEIKSEDQPSARGATTRDEPKGGK
jgi:hypothetical protein